MVWYSKQKHANFYQFLKFFQVFMKKYVIFGLFSDLGVKEIPLGFNNSLLHNLLC